jgi:hypothetical protein
VTDTNISRADYEAHRILATQIRTLYTEIEKLAKKKPSESITPLVSKKINHVIVKTREQVSNDEFLDAIETVPVEGQQIRLDEALVILSELKSVMNRRWGSAPFEDYRERYDRFGNQTM